MLTDAFRNEKTALVKITTTRSCISSKWLSRKFCTRSSIVTHKLAFTKTVKTFLLEILHNSELLLKKEPLRTVLETE